jgi:hypothetical protein
MALASEYFQGGKVAISGNAVADSSEFPAGFGKLWLNVVMLAGDCLPRGGRIEAQARPPAGSSVPIEVIATGTQVLWAPDTQRSVEGKIPIAELGPQTVLAYVVHAIARRQECDVLFQVGSDPASISLRIARR